MNKLFFFFLVNYFIMHFFKLFSFIVIVVIIFHFGKNILILIIKLTLENHVFIKIFYKKN